MRTGAAVLATILKWTLVLALGAALGGYIVFIYHDNPAPPKLQPGEDLSSITPGSASSDPSIDSPSRAAESDSKPERTATHPDNESGDVSETPVGQTGPDVDISVKPVAAGPPAPDPAAAAAKERRRRRRRQAAKPKVAPPEKPPEETFVPDQSGTNTTGGGTGTTDGGGTGTDGGGAGGTDGG